MGIPQLSVIELSNVRGGQLLGRGRLPLPFTPQCLEVNGKPTRCRCEQRLTAYTAAADIKYRRKIMNEKNKANVCIKQRFVFLGGSAPFLHRTHPSSLRLLPPSLPRFRVNLWAPSSSSPAFAS